MQHTKTKLILLKAKSYKLKACSRGQALIEVLVAVSVLVAGFLGILGLLSKSLSLNRVVADNYTATYLASEGIEVVKNILDHNAILRNNANIIPWNNNFSDGDYEVQFNSQTLRHVVSNHPLSFNPDTHLYAYDEGTPTTFVRRVRIRLASQQEIKVNSIVEWSTRGGGNFSVNLEDHFYNWRP